MATRLRTYIVVLFAVLGLLSLTPTESNASPITVDEIIFQSGNGLDPTKLSGTVDASLAGNTLTFVVTNTSGIAGGLLGQNVLTGLGFNLPTGVSINTAASNTVISVTAGSAVSPSGTINDTRWGYGTVGVSQGDGFKTVANGGAVVGGTVNVAIGTVQSMIERDFNNRLTGGASGANVNGPDWGLLSKTSGFSACNAGLRCVKDSLTFNILLAGTVPGTLVSDIENAPFVIAFGSPNYSGASAVPEPASLLLLGSGLAGLGLLGLWRRSRRGGAQA